MLYIYIYIYIYTWSWRCRLKCFPYMIHAWISFIHIHILNIIKVKVDILSKYIQLLYCIYIFAAKLCVYPVNNNTRLWGATWVIPICPSSYLLCLYIPLLRIYDSLSDLRHPSWIILRLTKYFRYFLCISTEVAEQMDQMASQRKGEVKKNCAGVGGGG